MSVDVAIYLPSLGGGGAERAMVTLANGMAKRGVRVDLVLVSAEGPYVQEVAAEVRVVDIGARGVLVSLSSLVRYLRRERPRAMLSALNHANVIAVIARRVSGVCTRLLISERSNASMAHAGSQSLRDRAVLPLMRWTYPRADGVVAVSRGVADDLARTIALPRERISVIYNPVVTRELFDKAQAPLEHPWLGRGKPSVVLGVGRLTMAKDFTSLIRAFAKVHTQRNCRLIILGEGELRLELEALVRELKIQDSVQLPGFIDNPFAWMNKVSLFVLSSAWEGLPNVLIQAMACGAPVVSTDCPSGPYEILEGGKWGTLVPVGNVEALATAINDVLNGQVKNVTREPINRFSEDQCVSAYLKALDITL